LLKGGKTVSKDDERQNPKKTNYLALGLCLGLCFGVALGLIFGAALDNMGFMSIGIGGGMTIGLAIGAALENRHKENGESE
jgi:hypothetical protein